MTRNSIKFNNQKIIEICKVVLNAYYNKERLFSQPNIEEKMLPEKQFISILPREKQALWLFFTCPGDKMIDSANYYKQLKDFCENHPDFFDKENLEESGFLRNKLEEEFVQKVKVGFPNEFIRFTVSNAEKLISDFNCDPICILEDDFKNSIKNLEQFLGYGKGESSLYLIFLDRYGIKQTEGLVPKIDRHFLKISAGCGVVDIENGVREDKIVGVLSKLYAKICNEHGFDALFLDPAMWVIGHELCSKEARLYCERLCPLDDYCSKELPKIKRKDTTLYNKPNQRCQLILPLEFNLK